MKKLFTVLLFLVLSQIAFSQTGWIPEQKLTNNNLLAVSSVNYSTFNYNYYYIDAHNIYRKSNSGDWDTVYSNPSITLTDIESSSGYAIAIGSNGNVLRSVNYGSSFTLQNVDSVNFQKILVTSTYEYFITGSSGKLYRSQNGGANWTAIPGPTTNTLNEISGQSNNLFAASLTTLYHTTNLGVNWSTVSFPSYYYTSALYFLNSLTGYISQVSGSYGYNYRTTNGGTNWLNSNTSNPILAYAYSSNKIYASGYYGTIIMSTDFGITWYNQFSGTTNNLNDITANYGLYCVGNSGTVLKGSNNGFDWVLRDRISEPQLSSVVFANGNTGWTFNSGAKGIYRTTDKGLAWEKVDSSMYFSSVYASSGNYLYATARGASNNQYYWSNNGGKTWISNGAFTFPDVPKQFGYVNNVFLVATNSYLYKSTNSGNNFYSTMSNSNPLYYRVNAFYFLNDVYENYGKGWVVGDTNIILKTTNYGVNWTYSINAWTYAKFNSVYFLDAQTGIAVGKSGIIARTIDGGDSWSLGNYSPFENLNQVTFIPNSEYGWAVGDKGTILQTTDAGFSWLQNSAASSQDFYSVSFPDGSRGFAVGSSDSVFSKSYGNIPALASPYNGSECWLNQSFDWSAVSGYGTPKYQIMIAKDSLFGSVVIYNTTVFTNNYKVIDGKLLFNTKYWWKVRSLTDLGYSTYSDVNYFITYNPWFKKRIYCQSGLSSTRDSLFIGMDPAGTDGMNPELGEYMLPPPPPAGAFDVRFNLPTVPVKNTKMDFRNNTDSAHVWYLEFRPNSGYNYAWLYWDTTGFYRGTFLLKDLLKDTVIDMKKTNGYTNNMTASVYPFQILFYNTQTVNKYISTGWNLVSVPYRALDMRANALFRGKSGDVYGYTSYWGYSSVDTLKNSVGYWVNYDSAQTVSLTGYETNLDTISIPGGWTLIGPLGKQVNVLLITSNPPGILQSNFYGYYNGYSIADYLNPTSGYWIFSSAPGKIIFGFETDKVIANKEQNETSEFVKFTVSDNANGKTDLFLAKENQIQKNYIMPPIPPEGVFDARFSTDKCVESMSLRSIQVNINSAQRPVKIKLSNAKDYKFRIKDAVTGKIVNTEISDGGEITINENIDKLIIYNDNNLIPDTYDLAQNYPNPFNPVTTIKYQIPKSGLVTIKIFDVLGREVKSLVNEKKDAGYYSIKFDASTLASGIYFYRLISGSYTSIKKMALIK
ncbi:MAG: T9SS type A sorting domain-containing protein [Ignavibacteriae bacterium]|nr:T9SS type A sorting domain-containing protein [Ignavibacteriota bacterium]